MKAQGQDIRPLLHPISCGQDDIPGKFTDPFRYSPCPAVRKAAEETISAIRSDNALDGMFSEGKMLGVLIVDVPDVLSTGCTVPHSPRRAYLAAFSGNAGGQNHIPGFVPPVFDLLEPEGHFKKEEAVISGISRDIMSILCSPGYTSAMERISALEAEKSEVLASWKEMMKESKMRRRRIRSCLGASLRPDADDVRHYTEISGRPFPTDGTADSEMLLNALIRESQHEKASLRRTAAAYDARISEARLLTGTADGQVRRLKEKRKSLSDSLQKWAFDNFFVLNALGEEESISAIFAAVGKVPPAGTGECAAPKLLQFAFRHGLRPLAMGEFWYGRSPDNEVREEGRFYPSCTGKCGPLLKFMLKGTDGDMPEGPYGRARAVSIQETGEKQPTGKMPEAEKTYEAGTIYEDEAIIAADKPSGMLSVPGKDGSTSLQELLETSYGKILPVHRLDMDTSGIIVYARTAEAQKNLRKQFEDREVDKTYLAELEIPDGWPHREGETGRISLPLSPDYLDRPRQKADTEAGREAVTEYRIISIKGNTASVELHPLTGRTHQLRVHAAHRDGLGAPIKGDRLYGGAASAPGLRLHAAAVSFRHPVSGKILCLKSRRKPF